MRLTCFTDQNDYISGSGVPQTSSQFPDPVYRLSRSTSHLIPTILSALRYSRTVYYIQYICLTLQAIVVLLDCCVCWIEWYPYLCHPVYIHNRERFTTALSNMRADETCVACVSSSDANHHIIYRTRQASVE